MYSKQKRWHTWFAEGLITTDGVISRPLNELPGIALTCWCKDWARAWGVFATEATGGVGAWGIPPGGALWGWLPLWSVPWAWSPFSAGLELLPPTSETWLDDCDEEADWSLVSFESFFFDEFFGSFLPDNCSSSIFQVSRLYVFEKHVVLHEAESIWIDYPLSYALHCESIPAKELPVLVCLLNIRVAR